MRPAALPSVCSRFREPWDLSSLVCKVEGTVDASGVRGDEILAHSSWAQSLEADPNTHPGAAELSLLPGHLYSGNCTLGRWTGLSTQGALRKTVVTINWITHPVNGRTRGNFE